MIDGSGENTSYMYIRTEQNSTMVLLDVNWKVSFSRKFNNCLSVIYMGYFV